MKQNNLLYIDPSELFRRFQECDEDAFNILYHQHSPELYLVLQAFTGQREQRQRVWRIVQKQWVDGESQMLKQYAQMELTNGMIGVEI